MKLHNVLLLLALPACVPPVWGDPPDAFKIMASGSESLSFKVMEQKADFFPNLAPGQKQGRAFLCSVIDANQPITARAIDPRPFLDQEIRAFATKNDYVMRGLVLYSYAPLKEVTVSCSDLAGVAGHRISRDNIKIMRAETAAGYPYSNFLIDPGMATVPAGSLVQYAVLLSAPATEPAGLYKGSLAITSQEGRVTLPVTFRVLDFALPEANISLGFFLPAHCHKNQPNWGEKWATADYTADKVAAYFHFWKTRSLNSPALYHATPEFSEHGKNFKLTFTAMDRVAAAMRQQKLNGYLVLDMRFFAEWAEQAAKDTAIANGRSDLDLFKEMIRQLITHAEKNDWPRFLLLPEEEISNGGEKITRYEKFWKPLREVAGPERDMIIDNDIGYSRSHAIDRGARDGYKRRQYNSWEQSGIDTARKDQAEIWTYNIGSGRLSWGFALVRYDSQGNHQWADKWGDPEKWSYSYSTDNGVISSLQYETVHTGITDFRYIQKLREKIARLRQAGKLQEAEKLTQLIGQQTQDLPLEGDRLRTLGTTVTDAELDIRRWLIAEGLSPATASATPPGKPEAYLTATENQAATGNGQNTLAATLAPDNFILDGKIQEPWWKGHTGPLRLTLEAENYLKATASSQEEFQRQKSKVSYSGAWVAYNQNGLLLGLACNHTDPQYVAKYQDGDADMWREDCMEFFFAPNDKHTYQLIVNPKGHKVMISTRGTVASASVKVTTVSPVNSTGGHRQEILIPWHIFGLKTMPDDGTIWIFNVGREFHSWNQLSCWTGVWGPQGGFLKFSGAGEYKYFKNMKIAPVYPGRNELSGEVVHLPPGQAALDWTGNRGGASNVPLDPKTNRFSFQFVNDPRQGRLPEYALTLKLNGKAVEQYKCKTFDFETPVSATAAKLQVFAGDSVACDLGLNLALPEIADNALQLTMIDRNGRVAWSAQKPFCASKVNRLWLNCAGLPPGDYKLQLGIVKNMDYFKKPEQIELKIIPTPYQ